MRLFAFGMFCAIFVLLLTAAIEEAFALWKKKRR